MRRLKHVTQPAPHPCVLMQRMVVDRRDRWPTKSHFPLSAQRSTEACNASNVQFPIDKQVAGEATGNASDGRKETRVGGGTVNCRTCAIRKGKEMSIQSHSNFRGQGLLHGG